MNRRCLWIVVAALFVLLGASIRGDAQPVPRVGFVTVSPAFRDAFIDALRRMGYQNGQNIIIDWRPNPNAQLRDVEDLVNLKPNLLFLAGPTNLTYARKLTTTIPIVAIDLESDPVASGIAFSLAHPGGNVTGIFLDLPELAGKEVQFLREVLPALKRLAVMWQEPIAGPQLRAAGAAAQAAGITMIPVGVCSSGVCTSGEVEQALASAMTGKPQALLVLTGPAMFPIRVQIANLARRYRLPLASVFPGFADAGALLGYGPNLAELYRQAATYVDRILKGASPADLPIERPTKFELVINLKTAKTLGLTIPPSLLARADEVIQ